MITQKDLTIGIITAQSGYNRNVKEMLNNISKNIPDAKIILVGGENSYSDYEKLTHIPFDETQKEKWVTKKKNVIAQNCKTNVVVMCHDYIEFPSDWFERWNEFGWDWDFAGNIVNDINGNRYVDLNSINHPTVKSWTKLPIDLCTEENFKYCYLSGAYWLAKTKFLLAVPLNENLSWGQGEDVEWCQRAKQAGKMKFNINATVSHNIKK
jgi:hypothetical protein